MRNSFALNSVCLQIISFVIGLLEVCLKKLLNCVGVPLGDAEGFDDVALLVEELNLWIKASEVFDLEVLELVGSLRLDERLDLRVCAELACADLEDGFGIFSRH